MKKLIYLFVWVILWSGCQRESHQRMEQTEEDSLNIPMLSPTSTKQDSLNWYGYQVYQKRKSGEADSAIHYLKEVIRLRLAYSSRTYAHLAQIYQEKLMNDSAIHYYFHALQKDTTRSAYFYCGRVLGLLHSLKEYDLAKQYIQGLRKQMKRSDIPYINLIEGDLWMELHQPDSAMKHYLIASETGNDFITSVAYERLALLMEEKRTLDTALDKHIQSIDVKNNLKYNYAHEHDTRDFEALKLKNELNELKVKQQSYVILILGLGAFILILCGSFTIYLLHRKRKHLMQENLLLKQQEEQERLRKEQEAQEKQTREQQAEAQKQADYKALIDYAKQNGVDLQQLPQEVLVNIAQKGMKPLEAYLQYENAQLRLKNSQLEQNQKNQQKNLGRIQDNKPQKIKDPFDEAFDEAFGL